MLRNISVHIESFFSHMNFFIVTVHCTNFSAVKICHEQPRPVRGWEHCVSSVTGTVMTHRDSLCDNCWLLQPSCLCLSLGWYGIRYSQTGSSLPILNHTKINSRLIENSKKRFFTTPQATKYTFKREFTSLILTPEIEAAGEEIPFLLLLNQFITSVEGKSVYSCKKCQ